MTKVSGSGDSKNTLYCSFCGKSQHEVRKLIAGPNVFICDECVELCMDIIREENKSSLVKSTEAFRHLQKFAVYWMIMSSANSKPNGFWLLPCTITISASTMQLKTMTLSLPNQTSY